MASISGIVPGFVPEQQERPKEKKPKKSKARRAITNTCAACGFEYEGSYATRKKRFYRDDDTGDHYCYGCASFFQIKDLFAVPPISPERAKEKIEQIKEAGYVLALKTMHFGSNKTGRGITINFGDVFKPSRISTEAKMDETSKTSFQKFTIDVKVGTEVVTLYTYEVTAIPWVEIMLLKKDGIYTESYVEKDDESGLFTLTEEGKEFLTSQFGER